MTPMFESTDLFERGVGDLMISMRVRVMTLGDDVRVLPGHGPETSIGSAQR